MTIDSDMHSHVSRSSAMHMALAAEQKGLRVLGLSEHVFQMEEMRHTLQHLKPEGPVTTFKTYIEDVNAAATQSNITIRLGLEVDFIPEKNELIHSCIQEYNWDFLIGSVHEINGLQYEFDHKWNREEGETLWLRYFELQRSAIKSGYFSVISHPVRLRVTNPFLPPTFEEELDQLAAEAKFHDIALEMNGYDMLHYHSVVKRLAKACLLHHTPVSVGSDAHVPRGIAQAHQRTEEMLRDLGITRIRLWNQMQAEEYHI